MNTFYVQNLYIRKFKTATFHVGIIVEHAFLGISCLLCTVWLKGQWLGFKFTVSQHLRWLVLHMSVFGLMFHG